MITDWSPLWITFKTAVLSACFSFILGLLFARLVLYRRNFYVWILDTILTLPLVLPPTVLGFFILMIIGRNTPIGKTLDAMNVQIVFTWVANIIASVIVSLPLMYRAAKGAMQQVDMNLIWAARSLGFTERGIFFRILIPNAWPGILAGLILAFTRGLGEFGATMMVAGNIPGQTQTMSLAIYFASAAGNMDLAFRWTVIMTLFSCVFLAILNMVEKRGNV